jgi:hypothetical protein
MALHALGLYQPGDRPMADIDILVRRDDARGMARLLEQAGFTNRSTTWKHSEYERGAGDTQVKLDLHTRLAERIAYRVIELQDDLFAATAPGVQGYPSKTSLLRHLLMHTAANMSTQWVRGIHLNDIALVGAQLTPEEWERFGLDRWPERWHLYPPLLLTARYFPGYIDPRTLAAQAATCPPMLARVARRKSLTELSASNPRPQALPAAAWCPSMGALVRYIRLRMLPEKEELESLQRVADTAEYGRGQAWFTMSQPARIASWLFRRPIRPATLSAVRLGLSRKSDSPQCLGLQTLGS